jgi:pimeloyl-ACP methyl ester carboxylesterase
VRGSGGVSAGGPGGAGAGLVGAGGQTPPGPTLHLPTGNLELLDIPGDPTTVPLVLVHEGLGSVELWRGLPAALAEATGRRTVAFSRYGHGRSDSPPTKRTPRFMHEEALDTLPAIRLELELDLHEPILVGHSDGASIALIHAAHHPVSAVVAIAPHVFVEEICLREIRRVRDDYVQTGLRERMARYHRDPDAAFYGWNDVWLDPDFASWNITTEVAGTRCPILLIQGERDQYGTLAQLDAIEQAAPGPVQRVQLDCEHAPHLERPDETLDSISRFLTRLP